MILLRNIRTSMDSSEKHIIRSAWNLSFKSISSCLIVKADVVGWQSWSPQTLLHQICGNETRKFIFAIYCISYHFTYTNTVCTDYYFILRDFLNYCVLVSIKRYIIIYTYTFIFSYTHCFFTMIFVNKFILNENCSMFGYVTFEENEENI